MIDTKIVFLAQLQAKLRPFKDLGVPPGGQISNPRKIQKTRRRAKKIGIFLYLHLGYLYTKNEPNLFFLGFIVCVICAEMTLWSICVPRRFRKNKWKKVLNEWISETTLWKWMWEWVIAWIDRIRRLNRLFCYTSDELTNLGLSTNGQTWPVIDMRWCTKEVQSS